MRPTPLRSLRRLAAAAGVLSLTAVGALAATPAAADTAPSDTTLPRTVSSDALPTAQIDGIAWDQDIAGTTVYVGGRFTSVRPAGAAPGVSTSPRSHMMAYDIRTGQHTGFAPTFDAQVRQLAVSPDGTRVYAVGEFTAVNGTTMYRVAAFETATGRLITSFRPVVNARVSAVAATNTTVYIGGIFSSVNGQARSRVAAVSAADGSVLPAIGSADGEVSALVVSPDGTQLVVGGRFTTFNGSSKPGYGLARISTATGQMLPLPVNDLIRNGGVNSSITSLSADADNFYGSGYHYGSGGNLEGTFAASWSSGALVWVEDCHGDTYQSAPVGDVVYSASHKHYCGNTVGGFPQTDPWSYYRATAVTKAVRGTVTKDPHGYFNYAGKPSPEMLNWYPTLDTGTISGATQGPWAVTGNDQYVVMGGEFQRVNNVPQQGLVRFANPSIAPKVDGPRYAGAAFNPRLLSVVPGEVRVDWRNNWDRDNKTLTYRLYRGTSTVPLVERQVTTPFWSTQDGHHTDTGLTPGSTQQYRITATDPHGNVARSELVSVTVATTQTAKAYAAQVLTDGAASYWRLGEPSGTAGLDASGFTDLTVGSGVTRGTAGAIAGDADRASTFNGTTTGVAASRAPVPAPATFSIEAWVRTTSTSGGKIVGFGSSATKPSSKNDRHLYMDNAGRLFFGVYPGAIRTVNSTASYNDGAWHHVVATLGAGGMHLYVDGALVGQRTDTTRGDAIVGFWRVGGDTLSSSWTSSPTSDYFAGSVDEVAVYPTALTAEQVARHYAPPAPAPAPAPEPQSPTASFTATTSGLTAAVDASGSSDPDGTITAYAWDFGDGSTGTGRTATRTYAAAGTYTVTLRVTDDTGRTGSTTRSVTVTAPVTAPPPAGTTDLAQDDFGRTVTGGWGSADLGGAWTVTGGASAFSVAGGLGRQTLAKPGANLLGVLPGSSTSTEVRATVALDKAATGGGTYVSVVGRHAGSAGDYRGRLRFYPTGAVVVQTARGGTALNAVTVSGLTYAPGERLAVRLQVTGTSPTTVRVKTWREGATEPAAWQVTSTDSTAGLQVGGGVGLGVLLSSTSTNAPVVATFDTLWAGLPRD